MHIEFIGCTSAGKSTLIAGILEACRKQGVDLLTGSDFVLAQVQLNWVKSHLARKVLVNLVALVTCLVTWPHHLDFYSLAIQLILQLPIAWFEKLDLLRNVLKKMGIYEIIHRRSSNQQIVLVDEGPLQTAQNLFVHVSAEIKPDNLSTFVGLVPLLDAVVYTRQPESVLIERTMARGHKRIPDRSHDQVERFIKRAVATFDELVQNPVIKKRLLVVDENQCVITVQDDQDDPRLARALKIIRDGIEFSHSEHLYQG